MFLISVGVGLLAFLAWAFTVAIRRDRNARGAMPHGPHNPEQSRAESQSRAYTGP